MTLQIIIFSIVFISSSSLNTRPVNNTQTFVTQPTFEYVNDATAANLALCESSAHEDIFLHSNRQKHNSAFIKMSNNSKLLAYNSTFTTEKPHMLSNNLTSANVSFTEKRREDAFEKRPATESPHAVLLLIYVGQGGGSAICSGSLLTPDWVLTAAHCLTAPPGSFVSDVIVYAGGYSLKEVYSNNRANGSQVRQSKMILPHPKYKSKNDYDIGLVMVSESFDLTDTVKTVEISTQPWNHRGYRKCQLTGFGIVQIGENRADDKVRKTHTLDVKQPCLCSFRLKMLLGAGKVNRYICARPRLDYGVCSGDSGGGLICDGQIRAVAMQIVQLLETTTCEMQLMPNIQCGSPDALSIFQDSCPFLRWVNSHVRMFNDSQISGECVDRGAASRPLRGGGLLLLLVFYFFNVIVDTMLFTN